MVTSKNSILLQCDGCNIWKIVLTEKRQKLILWKQNNYQIIWASCDEWHHVYSVSFHVLSDKARPELLLNLPHFFYREQSWWEVDKVIVKSRQQDISKYNWPNKSNLKCRFMLQQVDPWRISLKHSLSKLCIHKWNTRILFCFIKY